MNGFDLLSVFPAVLESRDVGRFAGDGARNLDAKEIDPAAVNPRVLACRGAPEDLLRMPRD